MMAALFKRMSSSGAVGIEHFFSLHLEFGIHGEAGCHETIRFKWVGREELLAG